MLRIPADLVELLDAALGDGTAIAVSRGARFSGQVDAVVLRGSAALILPRWDEQEAAEPWWRISRDADGAIIVRQAHEEA